MNDLEKAEIIKISREHLPDPAKHAKPGKNKIYRVPPIPSIDIATSPDSKSSTNKSYYEVEFELKQVGRNKFAWEYKRFIEY